MMVLSEWNLWDYVELHQIHIHGYNPTSAHSPHLGFLQHPLFAPMLEAYVLA